MKAWIQFIFASILTCVWAIPPQAQANVATSAAAVTYRAIFSLEKSKPFVISLVDDQGAVVSQFLSKPAGDLTHYLPSQLARQFSKDIPKGTTFSISQMAVQKLVRFPVESLGFFISLGAVVTYQMMTEAANNPVAFQQLIDGQMDPIGQLGFYAFMLANGATAEPFMHMMQNGKLNPRFAPFITYAGMSIGMVASNIVSEIGHWPGLSQCAKQVWIRPFAPDKVDYSSCDEAVKAWGQRGGFGGITNQWAPGLISLIGSTILASAVQGTGKVILSGLGQGLEAAVIFAGRWSLGRSVQVMAVELALVMVPGGLTIKGLRIATGIASFLGQMTLFNGINHWLENKVTTSYNNYFQSGDLKKADEELLTDLVKVKYADWSEQSTENLRKDVASFSKMMKAWRQMNMSEVLQVQSNWEQKLGQLTMMYASSELFYSDFINRMWQRKYGPYKAAYASGQSTSILDLIFPLNGVTVAPSQAKDDTTWLEAPDMIEDRQVVTIQNVVNGLKAPQLSQTDLQIFNSVINSLKQQDRTKLGQALDQLNCYLHISTNNNCQWKSMSSSLTQALLNLRTSLGNPRPLWQPGLGYIVAYNNTPSNSSLNDRALFQKSWGQILTPTLPESMMASMLFGPDIEKGESSVVSNNGFQDIFKAPRIRSEEIWSPNLSNHTQYAPTRDVFNTQIYTYLNRGYIRPSVLNSSPTSFQDWWKKYPETQYLQAWLGYENIYQSNIARLIGVLNGYENQSDFNRGPVSNGLMQSYLQEIKFYTMVLGEVMKDSYFLKFGKIPEEAFNNNGVLLNTEKDGSDHQLLSYLKRNTILDFSGYMKLQSILVNPKFDFSQRRNLIWQDVLLNQFYGIQTLVKKLKVQPIPLKSGTVESMPVSTLSGKELDAKVNDFKSFITALKQRAFPDQLLLNANQKALVEACFQGILESLSELKVITDAANAASYVERHDGQGFASRRCGIAPKAQGLNGVQAVQRLAEGC